MPAGRRLAAIAQHSVDGQVVVEQAHLARSRGQIPGAADAGKHGVARAAGAARVAGGPIDDFQHRVAQAPVEQPRRQRAQPSPRRPRRLARQDVQPSADAGHKRGGVVARLVQPAEQVVARIVRVVARIARVALEHPQPPGRSRRLELASHLQRTAAVRAGQLVERLRGKAQGQLDEPLDGRAPADVQRHGAAQALEHLHARLAHGGWRGHHAKYRPARRQRADRRLGRSHRARSRGGGDRDGRRGRSRHCLLADAGVRPSQPPLPAQPPRRPLRQRGDRQRRVDAQRHRHDRAVQHDQPGVHARRAADRAAGRIPHRGRRVEHPPEVVDHAGGRVVAHRAAAQRMHRQQRAGAAVDQIVDLLGQQPPHRVGQQPAAHARARQPTRQPAVVPGERRMAAQLRPAHPHRAVVLEVAVARGAVVVGVVAAPAARANRHEAPVGGVAPDQRQRQRALDAAGVDRGRIPAAGHMGPRVGLGQLVQRGRGGAGLLEQAPQRPRHRQILEDHAAPAARAAARIDHAGDGRADRSFRVGRVRVARLVAGAVGGVARRVGHRDQVAVGREAMAQPRRHAQAGGARAHQQLGRAERAGRHHDPARPQHQRRALAPAQRGIRIGDVHPPAAMPAVASATPVATVARAVAVAVAVVVVVVASILAGLVAIIRLDPQHRRAGVDLDARPARARQQVHVQRLLGAVVAAGGAVAAADARRQRRAGRRRRAAIERNGHGRRPERQRPHPAWPAARQRLQQAGLGRHRRAGRGGARAQRLPGAPGQPGQPAALAGPAQRRGPARIFPDRRCRPRHDTSVDERPAAHAAGQHSARVRPHPHVEQPFAHAAGARRVGGVEAHVAGKIGHARRKRARQVFAATLEHAHPGRPAVGLAAAGQFGGGHGGAVPAAHDDDVVVVIVRRPIGARRCQPRHQHLEAQRHPGRGARHAVAIVDASAVDAAAVDALPRVAGKATDAVNPGSAAGLGIDAAVAAFPSCARHVTSPVGRRCRGVLAAAPRRWQRSARAPAPACAAEGCRRRAPAAAGRARCRR